MASSSTIEESESSRTLPIPTGPVQSPKQDRAALNDLTNHHDSNSLPSGSNPSSNKASGATTISSATTTITITASSTTYRIKVPLQDEPLIQDIRLQLNNWCNAMILSAESLGEEANITPEQIRNQTRAMVQAALMAAKFVNDTANFVNDTNLLIDYEIISMTREQIKSRSQHEALSIVNANQWMALLASGSSNVDKDGKPVQPTSGQIKYQTKIQCHALLFAFTKAQNDANKRRNVTSAAFAAARKERESASASFAAASFAAARKERESASAASASFAVARKERESASAASASFAVARKERESASAASASFAVARKERESASAASASFAVARKERESASAASASFAAARKERESASAASASFAAASFAAARKERESAASAASAAAKKERKRLYDAKRCKTRRNENERITNTPIDERTSEDIATLEKDKEVKSQHNKNQKKYNKRKRENSYIDGEEGIAIKDFGEHDVPLGRGRNIMEDVHSGMINLRNIIVRLFLSPDELSTEEVARKAVSKVEENEGRFLVKHPDRESDRFYPINRERAVQLIIGRVETVISRLTFQEGWEKYVDEIQQKHPLLRDESIPSLDDLEKEYVEAKAKENEDSQLLDQVVEKIEKYLLPLIFCPSSSNDHYYHCSPQDPFLMQRTNGDICLIRYSDMNAQQWHQVHLDPIHVLQAQAPRPYGSSVDLLWCHTILPDSLHHGIDTAMQRQYMTNAHYVPQTESTSIYLHLVKGNVNGGPNWNLPPHALPVLQRFRVTDQPVKPDFILEIKLGPNGLFDQATEIWLIMVDGHACNIQLA
ncbi:hypothetical protein CTEN210_13974 [Chaetoceros tenuissimus]|uniref:Uncharacterized protein n=1 Tax=Chaetoceros tenuissimus TaxID=426638 RepID=A0AAD3HBX9_9STRA|nr:hypothetical protein CTEN210_13974 [Chaetoceros tenuissimus]